MIKTTGYILVQRTSIPLFPVMLYFCHKINDLQNGDIFCVQFQYGSKKKKTIEITSMMRRQIYHSIKTKCVV